MKRVFSVLNTVFLLFGGVVGAGFVSGTELVVFFGANGYIPYVIAAGIFFFVGFSVYFIQSEKNNLINRQNTAIKVALRKDGEKTATGIKNKSILREDTDPVNKKFFAWAFIVSGYVFAAAMLAGLYDLQKNVFEIKIPFIPAFSVVIAVLISFGGGKAIKRINSAIMPAVIIVVSIILILNKNGESVCLGEAYNVGNALASESQKMSSEIALDTSSVSPTARLLKAALFSFMNVFVCVPVLQSNVRQNSLKQLLLSAATFSFVLTLFAAIILSSVSEAPSGYPLPALYAVRGISETIMSCALFLAMFTSFVTFFYPLAEKLRKFQTKKNALYVSILAVSLFLASLSGLSFIVDKIYPVIGGFGAAYVIRCFSKIVKLKIGINRRPFADNKYTS